MKPYEQKELNAQEAKLLDAFKTMTLSQVKEARKRWAEHIMMADEVQNHRKKTLEKFDARIKELEEEEANKPEKPKSNIILPGG